MKGLLLQCNIDRTQIPAVCNLYNRTGNKCRHSRRRALLLELHYCSAPIHHTIEAPVTSVAVIQVGPLSTEVPWEWNWDNSRYNKHSNTRIKPLPLTNGHSRYLTVTPERALVFVGEWPLHITVVAFLQVRPPECFTHTAFLTTPVVSALKNLSGRDFKCRNGGKGISYEASRQNNLESPPRE
jgi:hypothetical protein